MWYSSSTAIAVIDDDLQNSFNVYAASVLTGPVGHIE